PKFVQAFGGKAFAHGTVHCTDEYSGAALWYAPGVEPDSEPVIQLLQQTTPEADQPDIFAVFEQMDHYHPQFPHWYLTFIGVEPMYQRRGYGTALIRPVLDPMLRRPR
ncbi:MAG: GNAT family N-acetyltransferase, partial [Elainellaceae cyanobacterium]